MVRIVALSAMMAMVLPGQTLTTLYNFCQYRYPCSDGEQPQAALIQGTDGNFYGTTFFGGPSASGTAFRIAPTGALTTLYGFYCPGSHPPCPEGESPAGALLQTASGVLYGTTSAGGANSGYGGTVFNLSSSGTLTTLYTFCVQIGCPDGEYPSAGLAHVTDGAFYGTTTKGGAHASGTVFKITSGGALTTLHDFCSQTGCTDGSRPFTGLVQATNGNFYGTTSAGGANSIGGTIFEITPGGNMTTLYNFCSQSACADGAAPMTGLIQAADGDFFGTTFSGGLYNNGTIFKITATGAFTTLYSFCAQSGCPDGQNLFAGLIQATDENFYGATAGGGANGSGTLFRFTKSGALTTLYSFCAQTKCADGSGPRAALVQSTSGDFMGATAHGGAYDRSNGGAGTIFSLSLGLGPFVKTQPGSAKVGTVIDILGTNLTGATSVTFNGTAAVFRVISSSSIAATVPSGATSGPVQVITPNGALSSNVPFLVRP